MSGGVCPQMVQSELLDGSAPGLGQRSRLFIRHEELHGLDEGKSKHVRQNLFFFHFGLHHEFVISVHAG